MESSMQFLERGAFPALLARTLHSSDNTPLGTILWGAHLPHSSPHPSGEDDHTAGFRSGHVTWA